MPKPSITAPVELYRDAEIYQRERLKIFARTWQFLGLEVDLVRTGDYRAETLAGYPVVVVRDEAGGLRGFHNLCRHRAGPLVDDPKGRCDQAFVCRFHSWRYAFDGRLLAATDFGPAEEFDVAEFSLVPIQVQTWRGFVFVNLDPTAASLSGVLATIDELLGAPIRRPARAHDRHPVRCNWKVIVENYLDGYHLQGVHPALASVAGAQRHDVHLLGDIAVYRAQDEAAESVWAWVWPNLGISLYRGVLMLESFRPDGPDRTVIDHVFLHEPEDPRVDAAIHYAERITEEDVRVSERVQQNLDAGVFSTGVLSPSNEAAVAAFQAKIVGVLSMESGRSDGDADALP